MYDMPRREEDEEKRAVEFKELGLTDQPTIEAMLVGHMIRDKDLEADEAEAAEAAEARAAIIASGIKGSMFHDRQLGRVFDDLLGARGRRGRAATIDECGEMQLLRAATRDEASNYQLVLCGCHSAVLSRQLGADVIVERFKQRARLRAEDQDGDEGPPPPFPVDVLPGACAAIVRDVSRAAQVPMDLAGNCCLAALALVASRAGVKVEWKPGFREPVNIYVVTALAPSEHKSTAIMPILVPLEAMESVAREQSLAEAEKVKEEAKLLDARIEATRKKVASGRATREELFELVEERRNAEPPAEFRYLVEDITPEQLATVVKDNRAVGIISDEATIIENMSGRYSPTREGQMTPYVKLWGGSPFRVDRRGRSEDISGCYLTLGVACQPSAFRRMVEAVRHARSVGLLSRFLFAVPESLVGQRGVGDEGIGPGVIRSWGELLAAAAKPRHVELTLSGEAREELRAWRLEVERRMVGDLREIADWAGKAQAGQVVRLAGILHVAHGRDSDAISGETMRAALRLIRYYLEHARRSFRLMDRSGDDEMADRIVSWAQGRDLTFTLRQCMKHFHKKKKDILPVLDYMVEVGTLDTVGKRYRLVDAPTPPAGAPQKAESHCREAPGQGAVAASPGALSRAREPSPTPLTA